MHRCIALLAAAGALAFCASACADSFGPDLTQVAPNVSFDCSVEPVPEFGLELSGGPSCTWLYIPTPAELSAAGGANISLEPSQSGTVTAVHIRVGSVTGPMAFVVERSYFQQTGVPGRPTDACCIRVAESAAFTPTANSVTTVPVNLPMKEDQTPAVSDTKTIADFDTLGLAVLEDNVPIPLAYSGDGEAPVNFFYPTDASSTTELEQPQDDGGFYLTMSADFTPSGGGTTTTTTPQTPKQPTAQAAPITFTGSTLAVHGTHAGLHLQCAAATACSGKALLESTAPAGATAARAKTYGSLGFTIKAGSTKALSIPLSAAGRTLLAHHRTASVVAVVTVDGHAYARGVTLKR